MCFDDVSTKYRSIQPILLEDIDTKYVSVVHELCIDDVSSGSAYDTLQVRQVDRVETADAFVGLYLVFTGRVSK